MRTLRHRQPHRYRAELRTSRMHRGALHSPRRGARLLVGLVEVAAAVASRERVAVVHRAVLDRLVANVGTLFHVSTTA